MTTQRTRLWGRAQRGQRIAEATPQGHWKVLTIRGALSLRGLVGTMTIGGFAQRAHALDFVGRQVVHTSTSPGCPVASR